MPKKNIPIGIDNFAEIIDKKNNYLFADKSLFIKEIIDDMSKVTLITRPRRWGKTLNMSMLQHFFAAEVTSKTTKGLFTGLKITQEANGRYMEYQGQYPVIMVSFKDVKEPSFEDSINKIKILIRSLYKEHEYLLSSDKLKEHDKKLIQKYIDSEVNNPELEDAVKELSALLYKHFDNQPAYILIDEYDTPLNAAYGKSYLNELTLFMKNLFSAALKGNAYLKKGVMTGILRISKDSMLSGLNNLKVHTLLDKGYKNYFGFTEEEVKILFVSQDLKHEIEPIRQYYNGYRVADTVLYNPWSIMSCLDNEGELRPYWVNTADDGLLKTVLQEANAEIKAKFQWLLEGKSIEGLASETIYFDNLKEDETAIWTLLLSAGYLTTKQTAQQDDVLIKCELVIPNQEIIAIYKRNFISWLAQPSKEIKLRQLLQNLLEGRIKKFASDIEEFLKAAASVRDYATQPEAFYHGFMLALTASLTDNYYVDSNKESGLGLPDLLFIPKDHKINQAIILEFKHVHKNENPEEIAKQALVQIDKQGYEAKISAYAYIKQVLKVGLAFDGKSVFYNYKTSDIAPLFSAANPSPPESPS